ncbi:MAG: NADP oxidoreductase [Chloroflexi bacterium]|nr:MAG: NADP oxidoreductase [Chloroflexota bacterium]
MTDKLKVGIIGSGRLGTALTRLLLGAGYEVRIANSRGPESLELLLSVLLPGAIATTIDEAVSRSDVIILALPAGSYRTLDEGLFAGKIVVDAMNYWAPTEGVITEFADPAISTSSVVQQYLSGAKVVKTLNHVAYNELEEHSLPAGDSSRRAVFVASDDSEAKRRVCVIVDAIGFDSVDMGMLSDGVKFQPDTPLFNTRLGIDDVKSTVSIGSSDKPQASLL